MLNIKNYNISTNEQHPFHMVVTSPWSLMTSFSLLGLVLSFISYFHYFQYDGYYFIFTIIIISHLILRVYFSFFFFISQWAFIPIDIEKGFKLDDRGVYYIPLWLLHRFLIQIIIKKNTFSQERDFIRMYKKHIERSFTGNKLVLGPIKRTRPMYFTTFNQLKYFLETKLDWTIDLEVLNTVIEEIRISMKSKNYKIKEKSLLYFLEIKDWYVTIGKQARMDFLIIQDVLNCTGSGYILKSKKDSTLYYIGGTDDSTVTRLKSHIQHKPEEFSIYRIFSVKSGDEYINGFTVESVLYTLASGSMNSPRSQGGGFYIRLTDTKINTVIKKLVSYADFNTRIYSHEISVLIILDKWLKVWHSNLKKK